MIVRGLEESEASGMRHVRRWTLLLAGDCVWSVVLLQIADRTRVLPVADRELAASLKAAEGCEEKPSRLGMEPPLMQVLGCLLGFGMGMALPKLTWNIAC